MRMLHADRAAWTLLLIALGLAVGAALLPDDPYLRWSLLDGTIQANARWIYERAHFDPTPIDVVFVGPSRMEMGVDAPRLSEELARRGLPSHVINASLPQEGRNIEDVIVREILRDKHPKLVVLGVIEKPSRFGHPAFKYIAPASMVADPGYVTDFNYLSDLLYLPYRQLRLFVTKVAEGFSNSEQRFDPSSYRGASIDTTGTQVLGNGHLRRGDVPAEPEALSQGVSKLKAGMHPPLMHGRLAEIEFGDDREAVRDIAAHAQADGVKLAFLYLPYYDAHSTIDQADFYRRFGPLWNAGFVARHPDWYFDYAHLDRRGSEQLTDWLVAPVSAMLGGIERQNAISGSGAAKGEGGQQPPLKKEIRTSAQTDVEGGAPS